jgi:hypothetical protein
VKAAFRLKKEDRGMARFIVIHRIPAQATQDQTIDGARKVAASLAPGVEWLNSWLSREAGLFCEWEAPDADAIRAALETVADLFPIEECYEVERIDPQWYK